MNRLLKLERAEVLECIDKAQQQLNAIPEIEMSDDHIIDHAVDNPQAFLRIIM